jgi:Gametolysin peptidase M11
MQSVLFADSGGLMTVDGVFNATSYGATRMPQSSSLVLPVNLGCSGTDHAPASWAAGWQDPSVAGSCANNGPGNWAQAAEVVASNWASSNGVSLSSYAYHMYILPANNTCEWTGLAYIGEPAPTGRHMEAPCD